MDWKAACRRSKDIVAVRRFKDRLGREYEFVRVWNGTTFVNSPPGHFIREALPGEADGFLDWEPK